MWKAETRRTYERTGLRYPTDVTEPHRISRRLFRLGQAAKVCTSVWA